MRKVEEWIGATDDTAIPPRVKDRIFVRADWNCAHCGRGWLFPGAIDHIIALCNGGENRESNLQLLCVPCHKEKTKVDVAEKSKVANVRKKHLGFTAPKRKIASRGFAKAEPQRSASRPIKRTRTAVSSPESNSP